MASVNTARITLAKWRARGREGQGGTEPKVEPAPASLGYVGIGLARQKQQHTRLESTASRAEAPSSEPSSAYDPGQNAIIPNSPNPHRLLQTAFPASCYSLTPLYLFYFWPYTTARTPPSLSSPPSVSSPSLRQDGIHALPPS